MTFMRNMLNTLILILITLYLFLPTAFAATWTQSAGYYNWYKVSTYNRYLLTTNLDVPSTWAKQEGTYIQCKSDGGATRYYPQGYDCNGTRIVESKPVCDAFVCSDDFGWTFNLAKNTVLVCPMVKIEKGVALIYEGKQAGQVQCTN